MRDEGRIKHRLQRWSAADRKQAILDELKDCAAPVLIEAVTAANPSLRDKDVFDIILHVAYDQKPLTRRERAENVKKRNYLAKYEGQAREVLAALLERYADYGVLELENEDVLELSPFDQIGMPRRIVGLFGGADKFDQAIKELEAELYKKAKVEDEVEELPKGEAEGESEESKAVVEGEEVADETSESSESSESGEASEAGKTGESDDDDVFIDDTPDEFDDEDDDDDDDGEEDDDEEDDGADGGDGADDSDRV